jgi:endo-1,4-beta-xylanase
MKVLVTEFDMSIYANSGEAKKKADREVLLDQAFQYKALFDMFKQEAKLGNLDLVLIWGIADKDTWLDNSPVAGRTDYPLFFGKDLRAKPSYWVMVDPSHMPIQLKKIDATRADHEVADINDRAWQLVSPRNIADSNGANYGWFKVMWTNSNLYVQARINDAAKDAADGITVFIEPKKQKADPKSEAAFSKDFARSTAIVDDETGYTQLSVVPLEGKLDAKIGFDIRVKDGGTVHSWNDFDDSQDKVSINYGTVNLRALPPVTYAKRGTIDMEGRRIDMDAWEKIAPCL